MKDKKDSYKEFERLVNKNLPKVPKPVMNAYKVAEKYNVMLNTLEDFEIFISAYNVDLTENDLDTINDFRNLVCNLRTKAIR